MKKTKPLVMIPTYKEVENISPLWHRLCALDLDFDVLFVNDTSGDGTEEALDLLEEQNDNFHVLHREGKQGIGTAHQAGISWAYTQGYETLITMDSDLTHSPSDIPKFLESIKDHDIVVGSRYLQGRSLDGWNPIRKTLTWTAHLLTNVILKLRFDATGAFRAYSLNRIPQETFSLVKSKSYSFFFESLFVLNFNAFSIKEVAIALPPRTYGSSKMSHKDALKSLGFLFSLCFRSYLTPNSLRIKKRKERQSTEASAFNKETSVECKVRS